jgi:hypothetical protein
VLRAELAVVRERYNGVRLHAGIGYVTPNDEHQGRGPAIRKARARPDSNSHGCGGLPGTASTVNLNHPRSPAMLADRSGISIANSETGQVGHRGGACRSLQRSATPAPQARPYRRGHPPDQIQLAALPAEVDRPEPHRCASWGLAGTPPAHRPGRQRRSTKTAQLAESTGASTLRRFGWQRWSASCPRRPWLARSASWLCRSVRPWDQRCRRQPAPGPAACGSAPAAR